MANPSLQVGLYVRLSEARPGEEAASLATQEADARAFAERKGWSTAKVYRDAGRSAWADNRDRPAFDSMLRDLEAGTIGGIVAWKQDRLGRRVVEVADLLDRARRLGAVVATVTDSLDTSTPSGRMAAQVVAAAAELESANTSMRVRRAMQARAEKGEAHGGPRPYGYRREGRTLIVEPAEAEIVKQCAARVLAGEGTGGILRDLQARGVTTSTGGEWRRRSLVNTLTASRIAGLRHHDGREVEGAWEPIVDRATLDALRAVLAPSSVRRSVPRRFYLSGGLAICARCGARLKGRSWASDGRRGRMQYHCPSRTEQRGCGGIAIAAEPLEDFVGALVLARLASDEFRARLESSGTDPAIDELYRRMTALDTVADHLAASLGAGELDRRAYRIATETNETERQALERELRARAGERTTVLADAPTTEAALLQWWESATVQQRHALTAAVLQEVKVGPAIRGQRTFDPERLEFVWRG